MMMPRHNIPNEANSSPLPGKGALAGQLVHQPCIWLARSDSDENLGGVSDKIN
eukprot:m.92457 g.92457  ORF g.92457 m.92457 type:complete len:53 (-) comp12037_c0_seq2:389-547(-)